jgi:hypothetical protein
LQYKKQKLVKKENDKRGSQTASFHEKVRAFHHNHPELTYRECLKKIKNNTFI